MEYDKIAPKEELSVAVFCANVADPANRQLLLVIFTHACMSSNKGC